MCMPKPLRIHFRTKLAICLTESLFPIASTNPKPKMIANNQQRRFDIFNPQRQRAGICITSLQIVINRITSYNVCYTKLLRGQVGLPCI